VNPDLLAMFCRLAEPPLRVEVAADLAHRLGVEAVLFLVRDPDQGVFLPPLGFPEVVGGPSWHALLESCTAPGRTTALVELPARSAHRTAVVVHEESVALVLLGGTVDEGVLDEVNGVMPLVAAIFRAETAARLAQGEASIALALGRRAHDLALALDAARSEVGAALAEAARLNAELKADDRRKDEFLAMLGHELRNPMAAIVAGLEVMRSHAGDSANAARARVIIERQTTLLTRLVDDLLDVARVTRGKIQLRLENTDLVAIVGRAIDSTQPSITARGHDVELVADAPVHALVDVARVEQMVTNLLTNAAKYMDFGGHIRVAVREHGGEAIVRVEDTGIGIDTSMLEAVFDPFVQVTTTMDRGAGGLGIGLTLARKLATLHGGRVDVESQAGVGSAFTIGLPIAAASLAVPRPTAPPRAVVRKRILVVDDNIDAAEMLVTLAGTWGHDAQRAPDGLTALALASTMGPHVVLLDIGLPGMDGYEIAQHLRKAEGTRHALIVAVSGYGHEDDRQRSLAAGCDDHLVKPVDIAVLRRVIEDSIAAPAS
jgi:signal transduction histidine kinase/CheY-like chemotaxis protein